MSRLCSGGRFFDGDAGHVRESASPPLGAFDAFFRWFPALKRRAGLTSPPLGAFANDDQGDIETGTMWAGQQIPLGAFANNDQGDREEGIRPQTCLLPTTLGARIFSRPQCCG